MGHAKYNQMVLHCPLIEYTSKIVLVAGKRAGTMGETRGEVYLTIGDAARLLGCTPVSVMRAVTRRVLVPAARAADGRLQFRQEDVERYAGQRAGRQRSLPLLVSAATYAADLRRVTWVAAAVATGTDLSRILDRIVRAATMSIGGLHSNSLLLLSEDGRALRHAAAVGLPTAYIEAIDGTEIGPDVGTCGAAAWHGGTVITEDLLVDPNWDRYRKLATPHGLRAVWSVPLLGQEGRVLGTFATYRRQPERPTAHQLEMLEIYARLAAAAVERVTTRAREQRLLRERTASQQALAASEHFLRSALDSLSAHIAILDEHGTVIAVNAAWSAFAGREDETEPAIDVGVNYLEICERDTGPTAEDTTRFAAGIRSVIAGRQAQFALPYPYHSASRKRWYMGTVTHFTGIGPVRVVVAHEDISERKLVEERLRLLESVAVHANDGVLITEGNPIGPPGPRIVYSNEAFTRMTGYTAEEALGKTPRILQGRDTDRAGLDVIRTALARWKPIRIELLNYRKDGTEFWAELNIVPVTHPDATLVTHWVAIQRDVTERKRAEAALCASEERLRAVVTHAPVILYTLNREGVFTLAIGGAMALLGVLPDATIGSAARAARPLESGDVLGASIYQVVPSRPDILESYRRALDGETHRARLEIGEVAFDIQWSPLRDTAGAIVGVNGVAFDITAHVNAQRGAERARVAAEELADLRSDFVASVSHELRTPLTAIVGYAELLQARWQQFTEVQRLDRIRRIVQSANRQQRLVEDLLLLTQLDTTALLVRRDPVPIAPLVNQAIEEVQGSYHGQRVDLEGDASLRVLADPLRALQVVANLLDNAAKYSPEGSPIVVSWGVEGGMLAIRVGDAGPGIAAHDRGQLFTRFGRVPGSRTRAGRSGTGLGLFLGRQLAEAMGGELELESSGSGGSLFSLRLPMA